MNGYTSFLNVEFFQEVSMRQALGFETKDFRGRSIIMKLRKSIYGLRQSPKAWNGTIDGDLITIGFLSTDSDAFVYVKSNGDNSAIFTLYRDDRSPPNPTTTLW